MASPNTRPQKRQVTRDGKTFTQTFHVGTGRRGDLTEQQRLDDVLRGERKSARSRVVQTPATVVTAEGVIGGNQIEQLEELVASATKKAEKLGLEPYALDVTNPRMDCGEMIVDVAITGPQITTPNDYALVGFISHGDDDKEANVLHSVDSTGQMMSEFAHSDGTRCDSCGVRHKRKRSVVVFDEESGDVLQVGGACVKKFLGYEQTPTGVFGLVKTMNDVQDAIKTRTIKTSEPQYLVGDFLAKTAAVIRNEGWVSSSEERINGRTSTAGLVRGETDDNKIEPLPEDWVRVREAVEWVSNLDAQTLESSEYLRNLQAVTTDSGGVLSRRRSGIAASIFAAKERADQDAKRKAEKEERAKRSSHIGKVGERIEVPVSCVMNRYLSTNAYGNEKYLLLFEDDQGNVIKTISTGKLPHQVEKGDQLVLKGTVSEHGAYDGMKQTSMTRCASVSK